MKSSFILISFLLLTNLVSAIEVHEKGRFKKITTESDGYLVKCGWWPLNDCFVVLDDVLLAGGDAYPLVVPGGSWESGNRTKFSSTESSWDNGKIYPVSKEQSDDEPLCPVCFDYIYFFPITD